MQIYPLIALILFGHFIDDIFLACTFDLNSLLLILESCTYICLNLLSFLYVNIHNHQSPPLLTFTVKVI
jgi:hypothetical protein